MKPTISRTVLFLTIFFSLSFLALPLPGHTGAPEGVSIAPPSREFIDYLDQLRAGTLTTTTADGHALGFIPPPLDLSELAGVNVFGSKRLLSFPETYDLRTTGKLTPVKDQYDCGCCWAFATMASLESTLLPGETWDFSENNLKNTHGFDYAACGGGNGDMSTAYFSRFSGPVAEADDPYDPFSESSPAGLPVQKLIGEAYIIPKRTGALDNDNLKQAVMTYGAVHASMRWDDPYYNGATYGYYYNDDVYTNSNHAVAIVGWDDNFDKNKFNTAPPGNGAFIIKNSWGIDWGQAGYFYISYYDATFAYFRSYVFHDAGPTVEVKRVYYYDPLGSTSSMYCLDGDTAEFANLFTAIENESLTAVGFYTFYPGVSYEVTVTTFDQQGNPWVEGTASGTIDLPGYHTVPLASPVPLEMGQDFFAAVKVGHSYAPGRRIPLEMPVSNSASKASAGPNQSFYRCDGGEWQDITTDYTDTNVCLKAITGPPPDSYTLTVNASGNGAVASNPAGISCGSNCVASFPTGQQVTLTASADTYYLFSKWQGDCSGTSPTCDVIMNNHRTVTAVFVPVSTEKMKLKTKITKVNKGSGTVQSTDGGIACGTDCEEQYLKYRSVTLSVTPSYNSVFDGWSGACTGTDTTCVITMDTAKEVTASFTGPYSLTVTKQKVKSGDGTVASSPAGIDCGSTCKAVFPKETAVVLTAMPSSLTNSVFSGWSGCTPGTDNTCTVFMDKAKTVKAIFTGPSSLKVTKTPTNKGSGTVTSTDGGIDCGSECAKNYLFGTTVDLKALPDDNSVFNGWSGCTTATEDDCTVLMDKAKTVKAIFVGPYLLKITKTLKNKGGGTVTSDLTGIDCGISCAAPYPYKTWVTLSATPDDGSFFASWSGCFTVSGTTCTVYLDKAKTVKATFDKVK